ARLVVLQFGPGVERREEPAVGGRDCGAGRLVAAVDESGAEERLYRVGQDRRRHLHARAQAQLGTELERLGNRRQALTAHELRAKARQAPFGELREALEELLGDGAAEEPVADEFQPLVVLGGEAAMRERLLEELGPPEAIAEPAFERRRRQAAYWPPARAA